MERAVVRERRMADLPSAGEALAAVHERDGYPVEGVADPVGWLESSHMLKAWVAVRGDRVVGHVSVAVGGGDDAERLWRKQFGPHRDLGALGRLFVAPGARGERLGERLTRAAMEFAEESGLQLVLDVMEKDAAAIWLYESLGWVRIGQIEHTVPGRAPVPAYAYAAPESGPSSP